MRKRGGEAPHAVLVRACIHILSQSQELEPYARDVEGTGIVRCAQRCGPGLASSCVARQARADAVLSVSSCVQQQQQSRERLPARSRPRRWWCDHFQHDRVRGRVNGGVSRGAEGRVRGNNQHSGSPASEVAAVLGPAQGSLQMRHALAVLSASHSGSSGAGSAGRVQGS
jgi:hypothetical protein